MTYSAERALAELHAQHAMLRGMIERCEAFADELDGGRCGPLQLTREVTRLRLAFEEHNRFEEAMLRPVLLRGVPHDVIERAVAEHVDAHREMRSGLAGVETALLREVIQSMRAHLDGEEAFLLACAQTVHVGSAV